MPAASYPGNTSSIGINSDGIKGEGGRRILPAIAMLERGDSLVPRIGHGGGVLFTTVKKEPAALPACRPRIEPRWITR